MQDSAVIKEGPRGPRVGDASPRTRLLHSGLRLFATQGYAKTSTRELAEAAGVNIASISYYFGDKAGLYRAVFQQPLGLPKGEAACCVGADLPLPQALAHLYAAYLEPLKQGDDAPLLHIKLRAREMLEPTGLWDEEIECRIRPLHDALVALLCRHLGLKRADDDVHRLATCIAGLGVHMQIGHGVIARLAPRLNEQPAALDLWSERLVMYAQAMIGAEQQRRHNSKKKGR